MLNKDIILKEKFLDIQRLLYREEIAKFKFLKGDRKMEIGVDLGTTNSVVSVIERGGGCRILQNDENYP